MPPGEKQPGNQTNSPPVARPAAESTDAPLSPEQIRSLGDAKRRAKKLLRTASVARFNGWTLAIFAAVTILGSMCHNVGALLVGVGLGFAAFNELHGGRLLQQFDARGPRRLGYNQLGLAALLVVYALTCLFLTMYKPAQISAGQARGSDRPASAHAQSNGSREDAAEHAINGAKSLFEPGGSTNDDFGLGLSGLTGSQTGVLGDVGDLVRSITVLVYVTIAAVGLFACTLTALYYFSRARLLRSFLNTTPAWIVDVLRAGG